MQKMLRSVLAGAIAGAIVFGVGELMRRYLATTAEQMDMWTYGTLLAVLSGFEIDRTNARRPLSASASKRVMENLLLGASWAAALFLTFEALEQLFGDSRGLHTGDWVGLAIAIPVVVIWWLSFRVDSKVDQARAEVEREARVAEIRRQAREDIEDLANGRTEEPRSHSGD